MVKMTTIELQPCLSIDELLERFGTQTQCGAVEQQSVHNEEPPGKRQEKPGKQHSKARPPRISNASALTMQAQLPLINDQVNS